MNRQALVGSLPQPLPEFHSIEGYTNGLAPMTVTVYLVPRKNDIGRGGVRKVQRVFSNDGDYATVEQYLTNHGLVVSRIYSYALEASGTSGQIGRAFGVELLDAITPDGTNYITYETDITLPLDILLKVQAVVGLDTRK